MKMVVSLPPTWFLCLSGLLGMDGYASLCTGRCPVDFTTFPLLFNLCLVYAATMKLMEKLMVVVTAVVLGGTVLWTLLSFSVPYRYCSWGDRFAREGKWDLAYVVYQRAFNLDSYNRKARLGMVEAKEMMKKHRRSSLFVKE